MLSNLIWSMQYVYDAGYANLLCSWNTQMAYLICQNVQHTTTSLIHSFIHLFIHSLIHSLIHSASDNQPLTALFCALTYCLIRLPEVKKYALLYTLLHSECT